MKISIIVPVYNCEKYLEKCIDGVLKQTYSNWELILVDDGSSDNSYNICSMYADKDKRIKVFTQKNAGAGVARNCGIEKATGEYLMFCDSDDFLYSGALERFVDVAQKRNSDLIISGYNEFRYEDDKVVFCGKNDAMEREILSQIEARIMYITLYKKHLNQAPWAKLYKASIINGNNVKFSDLKRCQDIVFNINYYEYVNRISIIKDRLYNYQTPDGYEYIKKFPLNMIYIRTEIDELITSTLKRWNVYDNECKAHLNFVLATDILVCSKLSYLNTWNLSKEDRNDYIKNLTSNKKVREVLSYTGYGFKKNICCKILKTGKYPLIQAMNFCVVTIQKIELFISKQYKVFKKKLKKVRGVYEKEDIVY